MTRQIGWIEEAVEGTDTVEVDTAVTTFGLVDQFDRPHPWYSQEVAEILQEDAKAPVDLVTGMRQVKIGLKFFYQHGWEWYYALGKKEHVGATEDKMTLGTLATNPIKSRSVYSRIDADIVVATGCKTSDFAIHFETPDVGAKPKPAWCELELWGWTTATHAAITADPAVEAPGDLTNPYAKGVENISVKTYGGNTLANLWEFTIGVHNTLAYHGGLGNAVPRGIKQLEGTKIFMEGICTLDGTSNDLLAAARAAFSKGASQDLNVRLKFNSGGTEYHDFTLENVLIHDVKPIVSKNEVETYAFVGQAMAYSTYEPIQVNLIDGIDYQTA